jgi:HSP20 family protein
MPFFSFEDFENFDRRMDDMLKEMLENLPKNYIKERKLPDGSIIRQMGPIVYGYSMTLDPNGKPVIREFGNVKPFSKTTPFGIQKPALKYREEREPLVDVISEGETIKVIAEVPGVDKKDIVLNCSEKVLAVSVNTNNRKYHKEIELPHEVDPKSSKASYINGVLEVTLAKIKKSKHKGERINIE